MDRARSLGFRVNTPARDEERGGTVVLDVPNGAAVTEALIRRNVLVDYRPGAGIRMAPHFYNTIEEVEHAMDVLAEIACSAIASNSADAAARFRS
jgi:kynureninase